MNKRNRALDQIRSIAQSMQTAEPQKIEAQQILDNLDLARQPTPLQTDKWIYRTVVFLLGIAIIACLAATYQLSVASTPDMPEIFLAIGSASVGALAGLLAPRPGSVNEGAE